MNRLNNLVEPEELKEVKGDIQEGQEIRDVELASWIILIIESVSVDKFPDCKWIEKDSEDKEKEPENVHVNIEERVVALLQGKPHGAIVHKGCRYLSDASRDLFVLELYFILKNYTKGRELIANVD